VFSAPLTGGTVTSTGIVGLDQTALTVAQSQVTGLSTALAGKANLTGGNSLTGTQTLTASGAANTPLTLVAASGQTADLFSTAGGARIPAGGNYFIAPGINATYSFGATAGLPSVVAAVIKGAASQTADLAQFQLSDGTVRLKIGPNGRMAFGSPATELNSAILSVSSIFTTNPAIVARGVASQTANLQEWQDSSGNVLFQVEPAGGIRVKNTGGNTQFSASAGGIYGVSLGLASSFSNTAVLALQPFGATTTGAIVRGAASQSANLQEWQTSAGSVVAQVNSAGAIFSNSTISTTADVRVANGVISYGYTGTYSATISVAGGTPTNEATAIIKKRNTSETGSFIEYQSSASAVLGGRNANAQIFTGSTAPLTTAVGGATTAASGTGTTATLTTTSNHNLAVGDRITVAGVTPTAYNGTFIVTAAATNSVSYASTATGAQTVAGTVSVDAQASITSRSAATAGLIIRAVSGQSTDLQQWQNSAGGVMAKLIAGGNLYATDFRTFSSYGILGESNSGGRIVLTKQTAATPNVGAGVGNIYFRDGTNAGTLKLVVRAGAAGAETTILDNIPQ
jgi:hypothetical protein